MKNLNYKYTFQNRYNKRKIEVIFSIEEIENGDVYAYESLIGPKAWKKINRQQGTGALTIDGTEIFEGDKIEGYYQGAHKTGTIKWCGHSYAFRVSGYQTSTRTTGALKGLTERQHI